MATSAPAPIAMPRSACASAGASLTPSPTMATTSPRACSSRTFAALSAGEHLGEELGDAHARRHGRGGVAPVAREHRDLQSPLPEPPDRVLRSRLFPVRHREDAQQPAVGRHEQGRLALRRQSARRRPPPPTGRSPRPGERPRSRRRRGGPGPCRRRRGPSSTSIASTAGGTMPFSRAASTIARASGCAEPCSSAAAAPSSSGSDTPATWTRSVSRGRPSVIVPVLSSRTSVTRRACSIAPALRKRIPARAPRPVPTRIAVGVARPSAQGQAMMRTDANATVAKSARGSGPTTYQATHVATAIAITTGTKTPEMRSASFWIGGLEACACSTSRAICASAVRLPTAVAAMSIAPSTFRVPPMTRVARALFDGKRLARDHRLVHGRAARPHAAVDRDRVARLDAEQVADRRRPRAAPRVRRRRARAAPSSARDRAAGAPRRTSCSAPGSRGSARAG